ncbi:glycosyltransferase [Oleiharenicola lentus]|uniref:glycosyltransferase n=1 Tax=Oleiharenicola lentus TaxID=2508720 RepID=UPI003F66C210
MQLLTATSSPEYFDWVAENDAKARSIQTHFHAQIAAQHKRTIPSGSRILEWGCGKGGLIRALEPSRGLGIDFSPVMIGYARARSNAAEKIEFLIANAQFEKIDETFDYIVCNFLTGYLEDIQLALENMHASADPRTRLVITSLNNLWLWPLRGAQKANLVSPQPISNWLTSNDLVNLLELANWDVVVNGTKQLVPFKIPLITPFFNRFVANLPGFRWLGITLTVVARPNRRVDISADSNAPACSVIVPMRNESGNVRAALERIPTLGHGTEIVFVEGNSRDDTWEVLQREVAAYRGPHRIQLLRQPGKGKWDAVRTGFDAATGTVLVIQDGDLTAPPEDLPKFYDAIISGRAEFANGSRLVYPMEKKAMRFLNFLGNKFFALSLSFVLGQPIKDSLCGTKALLRTDYYRLRVRIKELGDFDPFGDFNLLFGAALMNLRIRDIPVRYKDRTYGETNISRFTHGWLLLRMTWFGLRKVRFA